METGFSFIGPDSGRCKQIPGLWRGRRGAGDDLLFMYFEGSWGIKAHPTPAAKCVFYEGLWGRAEEGASMKVWGAMTTLAAF